MPPSSRPGLSFHFDIDKYLNPFVPQSRLHLLPKPISRLFGYRESPQPPIGSLIIYVWSFIGAFAGISLLCLLFHVLPLPTTSSSSSGPTPPKLIIIASFGASAILEYNSISSPLAQPRNVIFGQILSAIIGIAITKAFQHTGEGFNNLRWLAGALAVSTSSAVMGLTNTIHPPAGATALLAATTPEVTDLGWYLVPLVILGSVMSLAVACVVNNIQRQFPMYWWTESNLAVLQEGNQDVEKMAKFVCQVEYLDGGEYAIRQVGGGGDTETIMLEGGTLGSGEKAALEALRVRVQR